MKNGTLQDQVKSVLDEAIAEIRKAEVPPPANDFDRLVAICVVSLTVIFLVFVVMLPIEGNRWMLHVFAFSLVILAAVAHFFDLPVKRGRKPKRPGRLRLAR